MFWLIVKAGISAAVIVTVSGLSQRYPRGGAVLLTLPIVSILAFVMSWHDHHDLPTVSKFARETLVLVPLGLPFFVPLAFAERLGLGFWTAIFSGVLLAALCIGVWIQFGPRAL